MGKIKINNQSIAKLYLGGVAVRRAYSNGSIVYDTNRPQPCFEVVGALSEASGDYVDVYVQSDSKWYKKNNLNQYEEYGLMPIVNDLNITTYYTGKLVILSTDSHEYKYNGTTWVDLGNAGSFTYVTWIDPPISSSTKYNIPFKYYFNSGYKMRVLLYTSNITWSGDTGGFISHANKSPIEFNFYSNGYYFDSHYPTSTSSPTVNSSDYNKRVMKMSAFNGHKNEKFIFEISMDKVVVTRVSDGAIMTNMGGGYTSSVSGWYSGLYEPVYVPNNQNPAHVAYIQIYNSSNVKVNDIRPVLVGDDIQLYDSVIDAYYPNTSTNKVAYHTESEGQIVPVEEYDTKVAPANHVHYNTLAELELMECPWIGMQATIGEDYISYVYTEDGWVCAEIPLDIPYLRFTTLEDSTFQFSTNGLKYSINGGAWTDLSANVSTPTVTAGSYILFKGSKIPSGSDGIGTFSATGNFNVSGNVMSLLYDNNFTDKVSLSGKNRVFQALFINNTKLKQVTEPILPATTLAERCYVGMFQGCSGMTSVHTNLLPATTLAERCYQQMFNGCSSLTTAPLLPATNLAPYCYYTMFQEAGLTTLPTLPATVMVEGCYSTMYNYCNANIPDNYLPSTQLAPYCYYAMFANARSRTQAMLVLPATTLAAHCYDTMFINNSAMVNAPVLPAETLVSSCYDYMFQSCSNIKDITALFTTNPGTSYTTNWLSYTAYNTTGTFHRNPNATWDDTISRGGSTVPSNWNIVDYQEPDYVKFTVVEDNGSTFKFNRALEYSIDNGDWTALAANTNTPTVAKDHNVRFRGYINVGNSEYGNGTFGSSGKFNASGNLLTLIFGKYYSSTTSLYKIMGKTGLYAYMFYQSKIVDAENLSFGVTEIIGNYWFSQMFASCPYLTTAPAHLPDTKTSGFRQCYYMFAFSPYLVKGPTEIKFNLGNIWDCGYMFQSCINLTQAPIIRGNINSSQAAEAMFNGCSSLNTLTYLGTTAPSSSFSSGWLSRVAANGTFYMNENATWDTTITRGTSTVPADWTITKIDPTSV